jgi:biopolymer transport protein ExbD
MLYVEVRSKDGRTTLKLDRDEIALAALPSRLRALRGETGRREMVIDAKDVEWQTVVDVVGAAEAAGVSKVHFKVDAPAPRR